MRPFNALRFKYNWHWFWDTGNGDIGNQGVHEMDIARWGLGEVTWPKSVVSTGGKYVYTDDQETPNTQFASFDYGDKEIAVRSPRHLHRRRRQYRQGRRKLRRQSSSSAPTAG